MGKINILDASVANMIAAGEVVERPASVIKELVENSIDANASAITVEIKNGGISYMRVTDNGRGIEPDDVGLAFVRHATSKIFEAKDLEAIGTLGFRGEALCSVAAVAKVVLTTKTASTQCATRVYIEGGEMDNVEDVGAPNGTTIEVKNLFYNTPARMKFMKKDTTEAGYITDIMQRFVLAHPEISFRYISSGKQVLLSSGDGEIVNAIYTVYGSDYAKSVIPINYGDNTVSVSGYIGKSTISRPNRTYQSVYVNNRFIRSKTVTVALDEAYKNQLMGGKFPFAVIKLAVNPTFVDVNVHPNKTEVKFSDERKIFDTVYWAAKNALYEKPTVPDVAIPKRHNTYKSNELTGDAKTFVQTLLNIDTQKRKQESTVEKEVTDVQVKPFVYGKAESEKRLVNEESLPKKQIDITPDTANEKTLTITKAATLNEESDTDYNATHKTVESSFNLFHEQQPEKKKPKTQTDEVFATQKESEYADYKIVGALFNTYIIIECDNKALLIDQHAAHERLKFEQLKRDMENNSVKIQSLLTPVVVDLSAPEFAFACENASQFTNLGFDIEQFGENTFIVSGAPPDMDYNDIKDLFIELLEQMMSDKKQIIGARDERAMYTVACKAAIKANKVLSEREIRALVDDVLALDAINTCPHGRPIMVSLTKYELEKQFKRIV